MSGRPRDRPQSGVVVVGVSARAVRYGWRLRKGEMEESMQAARFELFRSAFASDGLSGGRDSNSCREICGAGDGPGKQCRNTMPMCSSPHV